MCLFRCQPIFRAEPGTGSPVTPLIHDIDDPWHGALLRLLRLTQLALSDEIAECASAALYPLGLEITCYLVDEEQRHLRQLPERGKPSSGPLSVEGTVAGKAFTSVRSYPVGGPGEGRRLWMPMVDGSERLGVVELGIGDHSHEDEGFLQWCKTFVDLVAHLIMVKMPYGDTLHKVRRTKPMSVAGEMLLAMLPPLTFTCDRLVISSVLEPSYQLGGDAFDYALDGPIARFHMLDGVGRGLSAAIMTVTALAAIRAARRDGQGLYAMARAADEALIEQFDGSQFVTGVLGELDMHTGQLRYINAGHPRPLVLRREKAVRELQAGRRLPLGLDDSTIEIGEETLEPGDRLLLYSDGVVEARDARGEMFGVERLIDLTEKAALAKLPTPETLRTLSHRVIEFQGGPPRDDATLMLIEWSQAATLRVIP